MLYGKFKMTNELTALSVLLVIVSVVFSLMMPHVWEELGWDIDKNIKDLEARKTRLKEVKKMLYFKMLPLFIYFLIISYLLAPSTLDIMLNSEISLWGFDLAKTLFVVINLSIIVMTIVVATSTIKLVFRMNYLSKLISQSDPN